MNEPIITTFSGKTINLASPTPEDIDIGDIAHALSLLCRFNGHCKCFYSVAEHSVRVSLRAEEMARNCEALEEDEDDIRKVAFIALLHDAAEAYPPGDIAAPLKVHFEQDNAMLDIQNGIDDVVMEHFKAEEPALEGTLSIVNNADRDLLEWEWRDVMQKPAKHFGEPFTDALLKPWASPFDAEIGFLQRFQELAPDYPLATVLKRIVPKPSKSYMSQSIYHLVLTEVERKERLVV